MTDTWEFLKHIYVVSSSKHKIMTTSFIGLGAMGYPMASRLAQRMAAGGRSLVHDASEERMKSFVAAHRGAAAAMVDAATATAAARSSSSFPGR